MSQNLNLLRQKYCRPATFTGKRTDHLFPLEEECEQGKALLAKAPKTLLHRNRQSNPPSGRSVFLMHCRHDGNRRG